MSTPFEQLLGDVRIVPVITVPEVSAAVPLAEALVAGGLPVLEITLRTAAGLPAIERIAAEVEGAVVGAGTVTTPAQLQAARRAGAEFVVSPGCTDALLDAAAWAGGAFLPGAVTASEVLRLLEHEVSLMKVLPGRGQRRHRGAAGVRRPVPRRPVLPDRWHRRRARAALPGTRQRGLHRRLVDGAGRRDRPRGLAGDPRARRGRLGRGGLRAGAGLSAAFAPLRAVRPRRGRADPRPGGARARSRSRGARRRSRPPCARAR